MERHDPVLNVVAPSDSASFETVSDAHFKHLYAAREKSEDIASSPTPPGSITRCVDRICALGLEGLQSHRKHHLSELRKMSIALRSESDQLLSSAPVHVQDVLRSAGPLGSHPALLRWCLNEIKHPDHDLVADLLLGFPLIGDLPIDPAATFKKIRVPILTRISVGGGSLTKRSAHQETS